MGRVKGPGTGHFPPRGVSHVVVGDVRALSGLSWRAPAYLHTQRTHQWRPSDTHHPMWHVSCVSEGLMRGSFDEEMRAMQGKVEGSRFRTMHGVSLFGTYVDRRCGFGTMNVLSTTEEEGL